MIETIKKIDIKLLLPLAALLFVGLMALHSATLATNLTETYFQKQAVWISLGALVMIVVYLVPLDIMFKFSIIFYMAAIILLILVKVIGITGLGATRWFRIGFLNFQPSELAKIATLLLLSQYFNYEKRNPNKLSHFFVAAGIILAPFFLILIEPDLGTSLVVLAFFLPILHWAGLRWITLFSIVSPLFMVLASFHFLAFLLTMLAVLFILYISKQKISLIIAVFAVNIFVGLLTPVLWNSLKPYQQNRIKVFIQPEADPRGAGYQIIQSKVAIGSGGFDGKGWHQGTQVQLRFLPEQHTDFIMAVIGEEFGFIGVVIVLFAFGFILLRILYVASILRSRAKQLLCIGVFIIFLFHMLVNVGMTVGLMPVTGLPLPFVSYGGSAMLINFILIGLVLNSHTARYN